MLKIPLVDVPSQTLNVQLGSQSCRLDVVTRTFGLYMDVYVNDELIIGGVVCQNLNRIVQDAYLGFSGDLMFLDTQGSDDPASPGLGSRYVLFYLSPDDLA